MSSFLPPDKLESLVPLLGSLARLLARSLKPDMEQLETLLIGAGLEPSEDMLDELRRWALLLERVRSAKPVTLQTVVESLMLRGVPEAAALLAVNAVAEMPSATGASTALDEGLIVSVSNLDFGILPVGQEASADLQVSGASGHVVVENDQVWASPDRFGPAETVVHVTVRPVTDGMLWTNLQFVTGTETIEIPVTAQWEPRPVSTSTCVSTPSGDYRRAMPTGLAQPYAAMEIPGHVDKLVSVHNVRPADKAHSGTRVVSAAEGLKVTPVQQAGIPSAKVPWTRRFRELKKTLVVGWLGLMVLIGAVVIARWIPGLTAKSVHAVSVTKFPLDQGRGYSTTFGKSPLGKPVRPWVAVGPAQASPSLREMNDSGRQHRALTFPEVPWQYWNSWAICSQCRLSAPYAVATEMKFTSSMGDRAGITVGWRKSGAVRVDVQVNLYFRNIEVRVSSQTGQNAVRSQGPGLVRGGLPVQPNQDAWLLVRARRTRSGTDTMDVFWSNDGVTLLKEAHVTGLPDLSGLVGVGTAGPHLPAVQFDSFQTT